MLLVLEIAAFSLACRLADPADSGTAAGNSIVEAVFGDSRIAMSDSFYQEADTFFHKGVGHYQSKAFVDVFGKLGQDISPTGHAHLTGENITEIMPWLYFSTRMNSRNVTAYTVTAFWLAGEAGRPDLAEQVLADARRANPRDYRVYLESGRLAIKQGDLVRAAHFLETGLTLWPGKQDPEDRQSQLDRAEIRTYRGLLYESNGDLVQAQEMYRPVLQAFPGRRTLKERLVFLETHGRSPSPPRELWKNMLFRHAEVCDKEAEQRP
ncbi:MAG: tetratricopeptide repeat protein [Verrucomicrobia bacterium]|nr:tetratricopeptide repeat protein [Verrucomicrobiota bacterium]MBU4289617.1 tetratricopeptide repeat protein [Verrucomicrobiota bacterium]MBU4428154.1 tetratricopeptide repeat protein [Verrucomicrobiota bacterium]MCG2680211.1 tetratricopeptide repeat protein [Kiritimatiellia bacterium]